MTDQSARLLPEHIQTLPGALEFGLERGGRGITFHLREEGEVWLPLEELHASAVRRGGFLVAKGIEPGDAVGVLGPNSPHWIGWAFAAWMAGAALVPLPYPLRVKDRQAFSEQMRSLMDASNCKLAVAPADLQDTLPAGRRLDWTTDPSTAPAPLPERRPDPSDTAVIQFTSGSTAFPKGAVLSHRATVAATRTFHEGFGDYDPDNSRQVSWLPFFHDWGLFGSVIRPIIAGNQIDIMQTESFARGPGRWFRLATERRARYLEAPPSAMAAAVRAVIRNPAGVDLSNVEGVAMGAEPVSADLIELMRQASPILGLDPDTLHVAYGMAEVCLGLTINHWDQPLRIDEVDMEDLATKRVAVPARDGQPTKRVVSCGSPGPGIEVRIATPGTSEPLPDRHVGEIIARTSSVMDGYYGLPPEDQPFVDGWLQTGDSGYLAEGELFITGRIKDIVIVLGRNYAPEDLEWAAERVKGVRRGRTVAFGITDGEGENVVIALEPEGATDPASLPIRVRQTVSDVVGLTVRDVLVVPKGSIPLTTSGKVRRSALKESYASGALKETALASVAEVSAPV
jgi:fatty-acyl-CoA synthase